MSDDDVVVIGGGAAGLSAGLVLTRALRRVAVVDAGAPRNAPSAHMHGFLGSDGVPPRELLGVDLALVAEVLPDSRSTAKELGVLNIAGGQPFALAPAAAPEVLAVGSGSPAVLYAGACALAGAAATLPVRGVR